jgi:hypothetical protein
MSTIDGGTNWQMDVLDDYPDEKELRALDFVASGHGWATGVSGLTLKTHFPVGIEASYTDYDLSISPNPFTNSTTFEYTLDRPENIRFTVYNVQSKIVYTIEERRKKGKQKIQWNAEGLPAGMYFIRMQAGNGIVLRKLVIGGW